MAPTRARNDVRQYDDLADQWWRPHGAFAALHWLARARGALIPRPSTPNAALLDVGCEDAKVGLAGWPRRAPGRRDTR